MKPEIADRRSHYAVVRRSEMLRAVDWVAAYAAAVSTVVGGTQVFTAVRNRRTKLEMNVEIVEHLPAASEVPEALGIDVHVKNVSSHDMGVKYVFGWAFADGFDDVAAEPTFAAKDGGPKTITSGRGWTHGMIVRLGDRPWFDRVRVAVTTDDDKRWIREIDVRERWPGLH